MKCLECQQDVVRLDNAHLFSCSGLTLQEYAIRHQLPLEILLSPEQINTSESTEVLPRIGRVHRSERARTCFTGLRLAGMLHEEEGLSIVEGDIRRLELLLWCLQWLAEYGFVFRQEYLYRDNSHRVVARNRLKALSANLESRIEEDTLSFPLLLDTLAVLIAYVGELHGGYLFFPLSDSEVCASFAKQLRAQHGIELVVLQQFNQTEGRLMRTESLADTQALLALLRNRLMLMPSCEERFYLDLPQATVVKEMVFDSAHFITDHPGKCSNLHGGRYAMLVKVTDRIDPATGFVLDYGYLKQVVKQLVVDRLDHQNLNLVTPELTWRSSTELLSIFIWEQLIEYLPGLKELQIYETDQSYCCYSGPSLDEFQAKGSSPLLNHFNDPGLGKSTLRYQLVEAKPSKIVEIG